MISSSKPRKVVALVFVLLFGVFNVFGDDTYPQLTFTTETGLIFTSGKAEEMVYKSSTGTELLSLLVYPIPPGIGVYVGIEARWRNSLLARIQLETAWPFVTGNLTDDDWVDVSYFSDDPDIHSDSTAYLTGWQNADFVLGFSDDSDVSRIETLLGLTYRQISWEGWDAIQVSSGIAYLLLPGQVIDYRQIWLIPWLGLSIGNRKVKSDLDFSFKIGRAHV